MTNDQMERRMGLLEDRVRQLEEQLRERAETAAETENGEPKWLRHVGAFANDPGMKEIFRLGREYREKQREKDLAKFDREEE
jgi:hypothetical protein